MDTTTKAGSTDRGAAAGDSLLFAVMAIGLVAAIAIGSQYGRVSAAVWVGVPLVAAAGLAWWLARGSFVARAAMAVLSMAMVALQIHVGAGENLYHFGVFVTLAILLIYRDWRVLVIAAGVIAVQHALFNALQQAGWGVACFTKPSWGEVFAHAAYVVAQTGIEVWIALRLASSERSALEVQRLVVAQDGSIDLSMHDSKVATDLGQSVAQALRLMQEAVAQVKASASEIRITSKDLADGSADLAGSTSEQAAGLEQASAAISQFAEGLKQNTRDARQANELAVGASDVATRGGTEVREVVATMGEISKSSSKISEIIGIIDDIAFQTNILALNAAVEAARAGEQGRGFAVVASEVRSLAQRSAAAARETKTLIEDSNARVAAGTKLVDHAGQTMDEMVAAVERVAGIIGNIAQVSTQQLKSVEEVARSIDVVEEKTRRNAMRVRESAEGATQMAYQAQVLAAAVSQFSLDDAAQVDLRPAPSRALVHSSSSELQRILAKAR